MNGNLDWLRLFLKIQCFQIIILYIIINNFFYLFRKMNIFSQILIYQFLTLTILKSTYGLLCYQCDSSKDEYCPESWDRDDIEPKSCDHVQNAAFCVKTTGIYGAIVGTRRFCSSRHLDNSCNEINLAQDPRTYYSCLYTCMTDGCNKSNKLITFNSYMKILSFILTLLFFKIFD